MERKRLAGSLILLVTLACGTVHAQTPPPSQTLPAAAVPPQLPGSKIDFAPLPLQIYLQPGERPAVAFSTPCIQIERMTNGFPPVLAFENFMFTVIGNVNESGVLPVRIEPVCV
jgi:hypothetical protein